MAGMRKGADGVWMNEEDYAAVKRYGDMWTQAQERGDRGAMDAAHDAAERLRAKYAYSGGADGSQYIKLGGDKPYVEPERKDFTYKSAPNYTSKYQSQIDQLTQQLLDRPAFAYDPEKDPGYAAYKKEYAREGQRAAADTMAQMAAMTGGMPSTAAVTASQQAGGYYAAQMADKIPELRKLAYAMYQDEGARQRADLDTLMALEQGDYSKYLGQLDQWNADRSFAYGIHRDQILDQRYDNEWNYQLGRDDIADRRYEDETAWERGQYASGKEYDQALAKAQTLAAAGDFSGYKALGYTDGEIGNLKAAYDRAQAARRLAGTGSRRGAGSGEGAAKGGGMDWSGVEDWVERYGEDAAEDYIAEHYKALGYQNKSAAMAGWRNYLLENGGGPGVEDMEHKITALSSLLSQSLGGGGGTSSDFKQKQFDKAKAMYEQLYDRADRTQRRALNDLLDKYGVR